MDKKMCGKASWLSTIALVLLIATVAHCKQESQTAVPTYLTTLEKTLKALSKPFEIVDDAVQDIEDGLKDVWNKLRGKKSEDLKQEAKSTIGDILNKYKDKIKAIYPGTRWCGDGDIAESDDHLGFFERTDACCRAHDKCPIGITAGRQQAGLLNNGIFTRSHCDCDEEFYRCLKEAHGILATKLGTTYFNILRPQCFRDTYPVKNCKTYARNRLIDDKCLEYNYDTSAPKKHQWFDTPDFFNV